MGTTARDACETGPTSTNGLRDPFQKLPSDMLLRKTLVVGEEAPDCVSKLTKPLAIGAQGWLPLPWNFLPGSNRKKLTITPQVRLNLRKD